MYLFYLFIAIIRFVCSAILILRVTDQLKRLELVLRGCVGKVAL